MDIPEKKKRLKFGHVNSHNFIKYELQLSFCATSYLHFMGIKF